MIDIDTYENMTWETPSNELEDAVENLLAEVKRLRKEINTLNEIIDTDRKRVYDVAQKLLEAIE